MSPGPASLTPKRSERGESGFEGRHAASRVADSSMQWINGGSHM